MDWSRFFTRKFIATTGTALVMVGAWIASQWLDGARSNLSTLFTALTAVLTAYLAGNVVQDHILKPKAPPAPVPPAPEKTPKPLPPVEPLPEE
jgi:hypothetical protein